jgi:4-oxalocrotonate tautomerase
MPFVHIQLVGDNLADDPDGKKARIAARIADAIHEETGAAKISVWVVFEEIAARDWYVGEASVETLRKRRT